MKISICAQIFADAFPPTGSGAPRSSPFGGAFRALRARYLLPGCLKLAGTPYDRKVIGAERLKLE